MSFWDCTGRSFRREKTTAPIRSNAAHAPKTLPAMTLNLRELLGEVLRAEDADWAGDPGNEEVPGGEVGSVEGVIDTEVEEVVLN